MNQMQKEVLVMQKVKPILADGQELPDMVGQPEVTRPDDSAPEDNQADGQPFEDRQSDAQPFEEVIKLNQRIQAAMRFNQEADKKRTYDETLELLDKFISGQPDPDSFFTGEINMDTRLWEHYTQILKHGISLGLETSAQFNRKVHSQAFQEEYGKPRRTHDRPRSQRAKVGNK